MNFHHLPAWPMAMACAALWPSAASAASAAQTVAQAAAPTRTIAVIGNPLGREIGARPVSTLSGDGLTQRRASTLDGLPGVAGSGFGPNSSRPVIRGLDGDRVRVLDNGGASIDASNLILDHALAMDPLVAERV